MESLEDAILCVENKADIVMLDNMDALAVSEVIKELKNRNKWNNSLMGLSGGINQDDILDYVDLGVDIVSISLIRPENEYFAFVSIIKEDGTYIHFTEAGG